MWKVLLSAALLTGCRYSFERPFARVHHGPAHRHGIDPVAALPPQCSDAASHRCTPQFERALASLTRMGLELAGHNVVDTELLNAETLRRAENVEGAAKVKFTELPLHEQQALLGALGIQGVVRTTLSIGALKSAAHRDRDITVSIAVHRVEDDALAWRASCTTVGGEGDRFGAAIDEATRCALEAKELW